MKDYVMSWLMGGGWLILWIVFVLALILQLALS